MSRLFTLREALELLPHVQAWLDEALAAKNSIEEIEADLHGLAAHITMSGGVEIDPVAVVKKKVGRLRHIEAAQAAVKSIEETGCILKDLDRGLLDFPALLDGKEVYLCWQRGEPTIQFWHRIEDGFAGRRRIGAEFGEGERGLRPN